MILKFFMRIFLFLILSCIFLGCEKTENNGNEREAPIVLEHSGVRVRILNEKQISYRVDIENGVPFLESIDAFLNWYTPKELENVERLIIRNRIPSTGEITPLVTTMGVGRLPKLKKLQLSTSGVEILEDIEELQDLEEISLVDNNVLEVCEIERIGNLKYLNLSGNPISSIKDIAPSESLISISLDRTNITTLDSIERFPNLISVGANSNALVDITALASLKKLQGVEMISDKNNFNAESLQLLKEMKESNPDLYLEWELK